jgi:uncharacterized membrane protein
VKLGDKMKTTILLKTAFLLYRKDFKNLFLLALIIGIISFLVDQFFPLINIGFSLSWLGSIISLLLTAIFSISILIRAHQLVNEENLDKNLLQSIRSTRHLYSNYILTYLIVVVIIAAGTIFFIIPGIVFAIWYFAALYVAINEQCKPFIALERSKRVVGREFFPVLFKILGTGVLVFIPIIIIAYPVYYLFDFLSLTNYSENFIVFISSLVIIPINALITGLIYEELKKSTE